MTDDYFAVDDGGGETLALLAGPTSKAEAAQTLDEAETTDARVVDRETLDLLTQAGRYDLDDRREA